MTCATGDSGILLTDFACANPSVNHSWIFHVLEKVELPVFVRQFSRMIYNNGMTEVEFAGKARGQFVKARGVKQGCPASGLLFAMAFDPIFRWHHDSIISRNPAAPDFLQPSPCAYANDFAFCSFVLTVFDDCLVTSLQCDGTVWLGSTSTIGTAVGYSMATTAVMSCWRGCRQNCVEFREMWNGEDCYLCSVVIIITLHSGRIKCEKAILSAER